MWLIFICILLFIFYAFLIIYYKLGWITMPEYILEERPLASYQTKVSVIIPARNETVNIANCIRSVLAQSYPPLMMEIIVVDDHSTDDTAQIAQGLAFAYSNVELIKLDETLTNQAYKKRAIEAGISKASGTLIVTTDADCTHNKLWLETIVQFHEKNQALFIAAPVAYITKNTLLSVFQTLDFMTMQGITGASVYKRFHTMCNGANLAYTKAAFNAVNGFEGIDKIPSGDDMLLMHKIYMLDAAKVFYLKSKHAIVSTDAAASLRAFFQQRIRWASKASHYADKRIFGALLLVYIFNISFLPLFIACFFSWKILLALLFLLFSKTLIELWFLRPVSAFFDAEKWLGWFPFLQPLHIIYVVISGWLGKFGKYEWKGRKL